MSDRISSTAPPQKRSDGPPLQLPEHSETELRSLHREEDDRAQAHGKHAPAGPGVKELEGPPPKAGLLWPLGIVVVLLAAVGVLLLWHHKSSSEKADTKARVEEVSQGPLIRVVTVQTLPADRKVVLPAEVHAWQQATLYAKVSGYLKTILVDKGDHVKANQVIGTLESPETDQQVVSARADLNAKKLQAARSTTLAKTGVVSDQDLENAVASEEVSAAALRRTQALQSYEEIRAPFAGVVTSRYVDVGALLPAATGSTQAAQPVVDVADLSRVRIWAYLGQDDAAAVRVGDTAHITFDPRPGEDRLATVARLADSLDPRTRTMLTELVLDNRDGALYPGEFVHVQLNLKGHPTPVIPTEALIVRGGKLLVAVIEQGKAHLTPVAIAADDGKTLQVSTGLSGGETIAINAAGEIVDNGPVRIDQKSSAGQVQQPTK